MALIGAAASATRAAPITGFQVGLNNTGFNTTAGVYVPIEGPGQPGTGRWKQEFVDQFIKTFLPKTGRHMDYWQIVDNPTTTWLNRSLNDYSNRGLTYETTIVIDKQALAVNPSYSPWLNSPLLADTDHDRQLGRLYGASYPGHKIYFGKGNEGWNIFGNNLPAQNLFAARAEGEAGGSDFEKAGRRWGKLLARGTTAFEQGFAEGRASVGKTTVGDTIIMAIEGFSPVTAWAQYQIDGMKSIGIDPKLHNAHLSIAQYAAGSDTDLTSPLGTNAQKRDALLAFINNSLVPWTENHRALARSNGLADLVDAYEMRLGTYTANRSEWIAFQGSPEMIDVMDKGFRVLVPASGGIQAAMNQEGLVGFPWGSGIFSLADWPGQFNNPSASNAWNGVLGVIDTGAVPEPSALAFIALAWLVTMPWGRRRSAGRLQ